MSDPTLVVPPSEKPGDRIGRYKILQQIGEGGCGIVYMAEQEEPVRRRVALKVIKLGMDTKSVIARFEVERQALAMMDHPNIAKVLDAGATDTGRPFFVMELVRGVKITDYCDDAKLSMRERLDLFIQVCQAVQHAHQKGIIHRDLKPSNILVTNNDGVPVPKIIDFGIAKATTDQRLTDKTVFTAYEQFIGTPAYMSPEQAVMTSLDVDTRSDIYSLGVLLYELITGRTPFDAQELLQAGFDEMRRTLREKEPQRPSTRLSTMGQADLTHVAHRRHSDAPRLIHLLKGDLDWIVMKALEKDRTRRYETASALSADIQRYLNNETVSARPPTTLYRFQKLVRRHKTAVAAVGAVAAALILGLGLSLFLFLREREAHRRAIAAEREQARLRLQAEAGLAAEIQLRKQEELARQYWQAGILLSRRDFQEAENVMNQMPEHTPGASSIFTVLAEVHGVHERWAAALTNFTKVAALVPGEPTAYYRIAALLAQMGEREAYQQHCHAVLQRFGNTNDPVIAERILRSCLILPPLEADLAAIGRLGEVAVSVGPKHPRWETMQFAKGLAEYRQGRFASAAEWLQKVSSHRDEPHRNVQTLMLLAMTQDQLKQPDQARATLAKGLALAETSLPLTDNSWHHWIAAQALIREAKNLVAHKTEPN